MRTRSSVIAASGALVLGALLAPGRAEACTDEPETGLGGFVGFPADGGTAPSSTHVFLGEPPTFSSDPAPTWRLRIGGQLVATTERRTTLVGEVEGSLVELAPAAPLPEGALVEVIGDRGGLVEVRARFTVGGTDAWSASAPPALYSLDVGGPHFGLYSCGNPSSVKVTASGLQLLFLVREVDQPANVALAVGTDSATAVALAPGEHQLELVGLDHRGWRSAASAPFTVTVPSETTGCNASGGAAGLWPLGLALAGVGGLRRSRRRRAAA